MQAYEDFAEVIGSRWKLVEAKKKKNDPVQRLALATVNSSHGETETNGKLNTLDIYALPCHEGKGNGGNPTNGTIFQSTNLQGVK